MSKEKDADITISNEIIRDFILNNPEIILEGFNKKVYEAINGLKEASSVAQEEQMNVELILQRAALEHQELLDVLLGFSEDDLQAFDRADLAPLLNRAKRKAQSVHEILFAGRWIYRGCFVI